MAVVNARDQIEDLPEDSPIAKQLAALSDGERELLGWFCDGSNYQRVREELSPPPISADWQIREALEEKRAARREKIVLFVCAFAAIASCFIWGRP